MKPHHAAALALVGWYLLAPPITHGRSGKHLERSAPLSKWEILRFAQTEGDCQRDSKLGSPSTFYAKINGRLQSVSRATIRASRENSMKPRHAAALSLVVWCLSFIGGKTCPKDYPNCMYDLGMSGVSECGFKTKAECEAAEAKEVPDFHAHAEKNGQSVAVPPSIAACAQQPSQPK